MLENTESFANCVDFGASLVKVQVQVHIERIESWVMHNTYSMEPFTVTPTIILPWHRLSCEGTSDNQSRWELWS